MFHCLNPQSEVPSLPVSPSSPRSLIYLGTYGHLAGSLHPPPDQEVLKGRSHQDFPAQKNESQMFVDSFLRLLLLLCSLSLNLLVPLPGMLFPSLSLWLASRPAIRFFSLWHQLHYIPLQLCLLLYMRIPPPQACGCLGVDLPPSPQIRSSSRPGSHIYGPCREGHDE